MIRLERGNLLEADVEAVVNTVNTVGVMGKGIALMFKDNFPLNFKQYLNACRAGDVQVGKMFVTENLGNPRWIINFPTKKHWRVKTRIEWVEAGLDDLVTVIRENSIRSIAIPPLGCGNGGLDWRDVRPRIEAALAGIDDLEAIIYEPTEKYQNVVKRKGVEKLTPARALIAEMVRRYGVLDLECSVLEVQKLAWFIERGINRLKLPDTLRLDFDANRYGPYSHNLTKLLDKLDGSFLHCEKRLADAGPFDLIWFDHSKHDLLMAYLHSGEGQTYANAIAWASSVIDGFESPLGMELLATLDWLIEKEGCSPDPKSVRAGLQAWSGGIAAGSRKLKIFDERMIKLGLERLIEVQAE